MSSCKRVELGRHGSVPEFKVEWEGHPIPHPVAYTRTSSLAAYAELCGPEATLNDAWHEIASCALAGAGAAGIAAIVASPAAALSAFKATFEACLIGKIGEEAKQIRVALSTYQEPNGPWRRIDRNTEPDTNRGFQTLQERFPMPEEPGPMIERIKIVVNTTKDDKDKEEEFIFTVIKDDDRYLDKREGKDKKWDNGDRQEFNYALDQSIPLSQIKKFTLRVEKTRYGSQDGCGWEGNIEVIGIPDKGVSKTLLRKSDDFKLGEHGNPSYKDFDLTGG